MDESNTLNATHDISLFKKIILYLNVSAFRIARAMPSASDYRNNYRSRGFSVGLVITCEYAMVKLLFPDLPLFRLDAVIAGLVIHAIIDLFFIKDIIIMAGNYNAYYNRILFYLFLIFLVIGIVFGIIYLNNQIGHLPADYNKHH